MGIIGTRGYPSFYGGFETAVRHIAPYLADHGWDVTVYGRRGQTNDDWADRDDRVKSVVTWGIESTALSTLSYGLTASVAAVRARHDVVLVMNVANGYFLPMLRMARIPSVVNVDGIEWVRAKWGPLARLVFKGGARLAKAFATTLVVDARAIGDYWSSRLGRAGSFIPYGADEPAALPVPDGLESGRYALLVARLVPENSIDQFLDAAETLVHDTDVVIVGTPPTSDASRAARLASLAAKTKRFHWLGQVSDDDVLFALWQHAGAYFHGHTVGGTNPALVQAMACGAPIIARDTVFNREVLDTAGHYVDDAAESVLREVRLLLSEPRAREELGQLAVERARREYSWERVLQAYDRELVAVIRGMDSP